MAELSYELDVYIHWDFGAAQHGKKKVDSVGSTIKRVQRKGVVARELIYNTSEPYVVTATNFCTTKFNKIKKDFDAIEKKRHEKRVSKGVANSKPKIALKRYFISFICVYKRSIFLPI